jgi:hypothetical protein
MLVLFVERSLPQEAHIKFYMIFSLESTQKGKIAMLSIPILSDFDARSLSNFIYVYGLAECIPTVDGGRTLFDVVTV